MELVVPGLNVFDSDPYQLAIIKNSLLKVSPTNSLDSSEVLSFNIPASENFRTLKHCFILLNVKIVKSDGSNYNDSADDLKFQPRLSNPFVTNCFKSLAVYINNTLVHSVDNNFHIMRYIEDCLSFDSMTVENRLLPHGLYLDESEDKMRKLTENSRSVVFYAKFSFLDIEKFIIPSCNIDIKLTLNNQEFLLVEHETKLSKIDSKAFTSSKVKFNEIALFIRQYKARENFNLHIEKMLSTRHVARYSWKSSKINIASIPINSVTYPISSMYNGKKPDLAILCLIENSRFVGNKKLNSTHVYSHHGLTSLSFIVDGEKRKTYDISYNKELYNYAQIYIDLMDLANITNDSISSLVDYDSFIQKSFFIPLDLQAFDSGMSNLREITEHCNIGLEFRFDNGTKDGIIAILYTLHRHEFTINANRTVTVEE